MKAAPATNPPADCGQCERLVSFRRENKKTYPEFYNGAVATFGSADAALLIVGLAPGLHGANRTARPFTGDFAGDLLYETLAKHGFSNGRYAASPDDGLELWGAAITNAVRCVPPKNKPVAGEIRNCRSYLKAQLDAMTNLRAVLCLGRIAHDSTLAAIGIRAKDAPFSHGAQHAIKASSLRLFDSYHCSRYNTNTRRLTPAMFDNVFAALRAFIDGRDKCIKRTAR